MSFFFFLDALLAKNLGVFSFYLICIELSYNFVNFTLNYFSLWIFVKHGYSQKNNNNFFYSINLIFRKEFL